MNARGDGSTGWSRAWKISIWARLHDGSRTYSILQSMQRNMIHDNLFNTHPPFQIDGPTTVELRAGQPYEVKFK
jgi:alpha-L-fucosidase 2